MIHAAWIMLFLLINKKITELSDWPVSYGGNDRASIGPSEAKARKPYDKTEFRTEFSRSEIDALGNET